MYIYRHAGEYDLQDVGNVARYVQGCTVVEQCRSNCRGHGVRSDQHPVNNCFDLILAYARSAKPALGYDD